MWHDYVADESLQLAPDGSNREAVEKAYKSKIIVALARSVAEAEFAYDVTACMHDQLQPGAAIPEDLLGKMKLLQLNIAEMRQLIRWMKQEWKIE